MVKLAHRFIIYYQHIAPSKINGFGAFKILSNYIDLKIMFIFPSVNVKGSLISFVSYTIPA